MSSPQERAFIMFSLGLKETHHKRPCGWCGGLTVLINAEHFYECHECQIDYVVSGYDEMKAKYPLAGKDERNPEMYAAEKARYLARAERVTPEELLLLEERGYGLAKDLVNEFRAGTMDEKSKELLGQELEQRIDHWRR